MTSESFRHRRPMKISAQELAVEQISDYIISNGLKKGDVLPPESVLAEQLQVSRLTLREAMRHFRALGILKSKTGVGAVISSLEPQNPYQGFMPFLAGRADSLRELAEMRRALDYGCVPLIISRITPQKLTEVEEIAEELYRTRIPERLEVDIRFHSALLNIPGNTILSSLIPLVINFFNEFRRRGERKQLPDELINRRHRAIVEALRLHNEDMLRSAFEEHNRDVLIEVSETKSFIGN